eukprot:1158529-Pelagomonas_calceolata.AAC.4
MMRFEGQVAEQEWMVWAGMSSGSYPPLSPLGTARQHQDRSIVRAGARAAIHDCCNTCAASQKGRGTGESNRGCGTK